jgi:ribosomal protein S18 acetylase RimI-like enzyme
MIEVRAAEPTDLARLIQFDLFPGDRIVEIVERRMLVAEIAGDLAGYVAWQHRGCIGKDYVNKLVVDRTFRRQGVAKALLVGLAKALQGRIFISTGNNNQAAKALLTQSGWTFAGEIAGLLASGETELFYYADHPPAAIDELLPRRDSYGNLSS